MPRGWLDIVLLRTAPRPWRVAVLVALAVAVGMALLVARASNAVSYASDAPETCLNCHVMTNAYATWQRGSHGHVTVCTDCHVPHTSPIAKNLFKAQDGMRHSYVFTVGGEPQVLRLNPAAVPVVQDNCIRCHEHQLSRMNIPDIEQRRCWDCHGDIHGKVHSLSASPHVRRPQLPSAGLEWMKKGLPE